MAGKSSVGENRVQTFALVTCQLRSANASNGRDEAFTGKDEPDEPPINCGSMQRSNRRPTS